MSTSLDDDGPSTTTTAREEKKVGSRIVLDVGGTKFTTTMTTLVALEPNSVLAKMFNSSFSTEPEADGSYFIDRSGASFGLILNWLRDGKIPDLDLRPEDELLIEAEFYGLEKLTKFIQTRRQEKLTEKLVEAKEREAKEREGKEVERKNREQERERTNWELMRREQERREREHRDRRPHFFDCTCNAFGGELVCPYHSKGRTPWTMEPRGTDMLIKLPAQNSENL